MFVSFYTELGNSSIADERVFLLHFILQQGVENQEFYLLISSCQQVFPSV